MPNPYQLANGTTKGSIWYGLHFYPGVAEYVEPFAGRVLVNEATLRSMDPTFKGCPVFVKHVDEIEQDIDKLRGEADGWVIESFYNKADGKHWVQFIITSEKGEEAIRQGYRLSNSYSADKLGPGGIWNDVTYDAEVIEGNFEHLALVPVPRYNESVVLNPQKYKEYCQERELEIQRIANSGSKKTMPIQLFKRTKVDNAVDIENTLVMLPKSKKEYTILQLVNKTDEHEMQHGMAHPDHLVDMGDGKKMAVKDMLKAYNEMCMAAKEHATQNDDDVEDVEEAHKDEPDATDPKAKKDTKDVEETEKDSKAKKTQVMGVRGKSDEVENDDDLGGSPAIPMAESDEDSMDNSEEELKEKKVAPEKELPKAERPKNASGKKKKTPEEIAAEADKRAKDREAAERLRNAGAHNAGEVAVVNFSMDRVQRGQQRYGSGR